MLVAGVVAQGLVIIYLVLCRIGDSERLKAAEVRLRILEKQSTILRRQVLDVLDK